MPNFTGSVTETDRYGCEDGDLGLCDDPDTLLCCSIPHNQEEGKWKIQIRKQINKIKTQLYNLGIEEEEREQGQICNYRGEHRGFGGGGVNEEDGTRRASARFQSESQTERKGGTLELELQLKAGVSY